MSAAISICRWLPERIPSAATLPTTRRGFAYRSSCRKGVVPGMTLYVYNPARERIGLVEDVRSPQWLSEYQDAGEIKLVCSTTEKNRALLVDGNRLYCTEQPESAIIIRQTQIDDDGKDAKSHRAGQCYPQPAGADRVVMATEQVLTPKPVCCPSPPTPPGTARHHRRGQRHRGLSRYAKSPGEVCWMPKSPSLRRQGLGSGVFAPDTGDRGFRGLRGRTARRAPGTTAILATTSTIYPALKLSVGRMAGKTMRSSAGKARA